MNKAKEILKSPTLWIIVAFIAGLLISSSFSEWRDMAPVDMRDLHDGAKIAYEFQQADESFSSLTESNRFYYQPSHQLPDSPRFYLHADTNIDKGMLIQL